MDSWFHSHDQSVIHLSLQTKDHHLIHIKWWSNLFISLGFKNNGGGRGFEPREPLSPCRFSRPILQPDLGIPPNEHNNYNIIARHKSQTFFVLHQCFSFKYSSTEFATALPS